MTRIIAALVCLSLVFVGIDGAWAATKKTKKKAPAKPAATAPAEKLIVVEAEGVAPVVDGKKNEAREAAKTYLNRDALEKAIGAYVESVTQIENYQAVKDKVFSQTRGLVKRIDIKNEWVDENDLLHITATCGVVEKALDGVLGPAVIDAMGNPRVAVVLDERIEDKPSFLSTAESAVLSVFGNAGFSLIESSRTRKLRELDLASSNREELQKIAQDYRADVLIFGKAYATAYNRMHRLGHWIYNTQSIVQIQAFLADTEQIVGSKEFSMRDTSGGGSVEDSALHVLKPTATKAAQEIVNQVAYKLTSGATGDVPAVKLKLAGMNFNTVRALKEELTGLGGVTRVDQRRFQNGELELDVISDKTADSLAELLADKGYDITTVTFRLIEGRGPSAGGNPE